MGMQVYLESPHGDRLWVTERAASGPKSLPTGDDMQHERLPTLDEARRLGLGREEVREMLLAAYQHAETVPSDLYVTSNYSTRLATLADEGAVSAETGRLLYDLSGKTGAEIFPRVITAIQELSALGEPEVPDYWKATAGNIIRTLRVLEGWSLEHGEGVFVTF